MVLGEFNVRDVEAACKHLITDRREFFPPAGVIYQQALVERAARLEHERLPDFSGFHALPESEQQALLEAGQRASAATRLDPESPALYPIADGSEHVEELSK